MTTKAETKRTEFAKFVHLLAGDHDFDQALRDTNILCRLAKQLNRLIETDVAVGLTDRQKKSYENIITRIGTIADEYDCNVRVDGNPRDLASIARQTMAY